MNDVCDPRAEYPKILNKWMDAAGMVRVDVEWDDAEIKAIIRANRKEPCVYPDCLQGRPCDVSCTH